MTLKVTGFVPAGKEHAQLMLEEALKGKTLLSTSIRQDKIIENDELVDVFRHVFRYEDNLNVVIYAYTDTVMTIDDAIAILKLIVAE